MKTSDGRPIYVIKNSDILITLRYSNDFGPSHKEFDRDLQFACTVLKTGSIQLLSFNQVELAPEHLIVAARLKDELGGTTLCETCNGQGETMRMVCYGNEPYEKIDKCPDCNGEGVLIER